MVNSEGSPLNLVRQRVHDMVLSERGNIARRSRLCVKSTYVKTPDLFTCKFGKHSVRLPNHQHDVSTSSWSCGFKDPTEPCIRLEYKTSSATPTSNPPFHCRNDEELCRIASHPCTILKALTTLRTKSENIEGQLASLHLMEPSYAHLRSLTDGISCWGPLGK